MPEGGSLGSGLASIHAATCQPPFLSERQRPSDPEPGKPMEASSVLITLFCPQGFIFMVPSHEGPPVVVRRLTQWFKFH